MKANVIQVFPFNIDKIKLLTLRGPKGETGYPTPEQVQAAVDAWLEDHPEATTTVQDGAITTVKLADNAVTEDKLSESLQSLLITDTASGSIASFTDGSDGIPVRDLSVNVEPSQDLHGYANPWPEGGGKNIFPNSDYWEQGAIGTDGVPSTSTTYYRTANYFPIKGNSAIVTSGYTVTEANQFRIFFYDSSYQFIEYKQGANISYTTPSNAMYFKARWHNSVNMSGAQVEYGSTATTYEPYSNICPITGWDEVKVTRTGKNLFHDLLAESITNAGLVFTIDGHGNVQISGTATAAYPQVPLRENISIRNSAIVPVGTTVTLSTTVEGAPSGSQVYAIWYEREDANTNVNILAHSTISGAVTFTTTQPYTYLIIVAQGNNLTYNNTKAHIQAEYGTVATAFETAVSDTYTISLSSAGTVYGGTLDVSTGVLTVDRAMVDLGTLTWTRDTVWQRFYASVSNSYSPAAVDVYHGISSIYKAIRFNDMTDITQDGIMAMSSGKNLTVRNLALMENNATAFKTAMSGQTLVYELATPTTVQLTAQQLTTLVGQNNIFADCGNVDVDYVADTKLYIAKMIANALNA